MARSLFARAIIAFLILPGTVGFLIPLLLIAPRDFGAFGMAGLVPLALGLILLLWSVGEFYVAGRGTLAPWAPPRALVISGPYRLSRNPMYVGVLLALCGWAVGFRSWLLVGYGVAVALAFHVRVVLKEEPLLAQAHGQAWALYRSRVPRWIGVPRTASSPVRARPASR